MHIDRLLFSRAQEAFNNNDHEKVARFLRAHAVQRAKIHAARVRRLRERNIAGR